MDVDVDDRGASAEESEADAMETEESGKEREPSGSNVEEEFDAEEQQTIDPFWDEEDDAPVYKDEAEKKRILENLAKAKKKHEEEMKARYASLSELN